MIAANNDFFRTDYFTFFGQIVILILIQIGGLGVMTISVALFRWIGRSVSFRHRMVMQDLFTHTPREDIFGLVKSIVLFTISAEMIGAVSLTIHWNRQLPLELAAYTAVFHSISAFCNAVRPVFRQYGALQRQCFAQHDDLLPDCCWRYRVSGAL